MMYACIKLCELLGEDGVIFISIDDNELYNLKLMLDEMFGSENFVATYIWTARSGKGNIVKNIAISHEYIICYSNNIQNPNLKNIELFVLGKMVPMLPRIRFNSLF